MGLLFWRVFCQPCDVTVKRMAPIEGTNWAGHDLELFQLLARHLLGLVVWYGCPVATFGGFSCSKQCCIVSRATSHPPTPLLCWTEISAHQKRIVSKALKSSHQSFTIKVNYTKSNGLLYLLLLIQDSQLQVAGCFN